ncbi:type IV pilus secretin PilQ [Oceanimonas doudoroffii]|uniref:Type IV pilus secretin PilQ n=2 Tax=Aeromonadaceae TaxID=84642 RepID=A0A233RK93_9GAMM|nr:type IV pilus secretin PilQ [Oceanimonas doudoroffii]
MALALIWAAPAPTLAASLEQIRINPLAGEQLALELEFDEPPVVTDSMLGAPNRLVLRMPGATSALLENRIPVERLGIEAVEARSVSGALEVVISMAQPLPYRLQPEGNRVRLLLGKDLAGTTSTGTALPPGATNAIGGIDFRRGREGQGQVLISLDNPSAAVDMQERGNQLIVSFHNTHVPEAQLKSYRVGDFATLVERIEVRRERNKALITVSTTEAYDYHYDQSRRLFVLELVPATRAKAVSVTQKRYDGKPISMNFQDIPVRTVLQLIADFNNFNLVTTDSVQGNLTLRLDGVPWEQALDTILQVRGLGKRLDGNILLVAPAAELAQQEQRQLEHQQAQEVLAPLETEFLQVNYAKAADVVALLTNESTGLLTERGAIAVDDRTNMLVIKDTRASIESIRRMLSLLDIPIKQVVIEARMVTIDDGFEEAFGVRWGYSNDNTSGSNTQSVSGTLEGLRSDNDTSLNVNLPVAGAAGNVAFQIAKLNGGRILDLELSALERENRAEIIASPRVTTSNQKPALIEQGTQVPYSSSSGEGGTEVQFQDAVLSLKVTPQITPDNRVVLDLTVTQDAIGERIPQATGGEAVAINTQSITTQVLVNDGETLVLGGIFQQNITRNVTKVPLLGDIPVVGNLFKTTRDNNSKRELIIFVTPRIVHDSI